MAGLKVKKNQQPITGIGEGEISPYVFLCGDPERVPKITKGWKDLQEHCRIREYVIQSGTLNGVFLTAASTGIGGPSTAVIVEELAKVGAATFLRVGNSGALSPKIELGDYVITSASVRDEGTSRSYVTPNYPAVASFEVLQALVNAARAQETPWHLGISWSVDAFYARNKAFGPDGELCSMSYEGYSQTGMNDKVRDMQQARVLNVEMESSTILTLANLFGLRAGCICTVSDRTPWPGPGQDMIRLDKNMAGAIALATEAMLALATG
jgi:uridine phosphorylase